MEFKAYWQEKFKNNPVITLFCLILIVSFILMILLSFCTRSWYFRWAMDMDFDAQLFGDHFDSMMYSIDHPYTIQHVIYPPLITAFYALLGWAALPYASAIGDNLSQQFANSPVGMMGFICTMIVALIALNYLFHYVLDKEFGGTCTSVVFCCLLLSTPFIYAIERGNCIYYSVIFLILFLLGYKSEDKKIRYLAYVCLAIATSIKMFPIMFAFLLLRDRRFAEFFWCGIICAILLVVPFVFFDGTPFDLLNTIFNYSQPGETGGNKLNMRQWLAILCNYLFGDPMPKVGTVIVSAILLFSIGLICFDKKMTQWEAVALLGCNMCIGFAIPAAYIYLNLLPAILVLLATEKELTRYILMMDILFAAVFCMMIPLAQIKSVIVAIIMVILMVQSIRRLIENRSKNAGTMPEGS